VALTAVAAVSHAASGNPCLAGKLKCVGQKTQSLLVCRQKAASRGVDPTADPKAQQCVQKARGKFGSCFVKVKPKGGGVCRATPDATAMEAKVDAFVLDVAGALSGP
jgi:hypothetical protein